MKVNIYLTLFILISNDSSGKAQRKRYWISSLTSPADIVPLIPAAPPAAQSISAADSSLFFLLRPEAGWQRRKQT